MQIILAFWFCSPDNKFQYIFSHRWGKIAKSISQQENVFLGLRKHRKEFSISVYKVQQNSLEKFCPGTWEVPLKICNFQEDL